MGQQIKKKQRKKKNYEQSRALRELEQNYWGERSVEILFFIFDLFPADENVLQALLYSMHIASVSVLLGNMIFVFVCYSLLFPMLWLFFSMLIGFATCSVLSDDFCFSCYYPPPSLAHSYTLSHVFNIYFTPIYAFYIQYLFGLACILHFQFLCFIFFLLLSVRRSLFLFSRVVFFHVI